MVEHEQEPLRRFLRVLCGGDSFRADDIAQEALLKAYMSFGRFEGRSKFSTWLFRIAYNCFYDYKSRASRTETEELLPVHEKKPDESADSASGFRYQDLYLAIKSLSDAEQAVILLFYMEDKSIKDIETITGMPSGTIRSHLSRGRQHLKNYITRLSAGRTAPSVKAVQDTALSSQDNDKKSEIMQ